MSKLDSLIINGWCILAHPIFLNQFESIMDEVAQLRKKHPTLYHKKNATKRLAAITKLIFEKIPEDPSSPLFRQGGTLGSDNKHWFRAKFFQQYRLFFRYHAESKIIIYAWVNDDKTKRAYESKSDAYSIFLKMLKKGKPPNDWNDLLKEAQSENKRFKDLVEYE